MMTYAFTALGGDARLEVIDQPEPEPRAGEAAIAVDTVAVNRLDLWVLSGKAPGSAVSLPYVPGIDPAGVVVAIGEGVDHLAVGDRVVAKPNIACLTCASCLGGRPFACTRQTIVGVHRPGGFAPVVTIPAINAITLPASVSSQAATAAIHSFPVALRMLKEAGGARPGMQALVIGGAGAVGSAAVQLCRRQGAVVAALVGGEEKAALVERLGASPIDHTRETDLIAAIGRATGGRGPDLVLDTAGAGPLAAAALASLAWEGVYATCAAHGGGRIELDLATLYRKRQRLVGSASSGFDDVAEVLADLAAGVIETQIDSVRPVEKAAEAYASLRSRSNLGKIVLRHERE